ncbi:MAG: SOS response-associated peptidase [Alphaproteobacteria bacterium]|nr:SOS response-associated peptidase [Alphaproteobacteria bacterium]
MCNDFGNHLPYSAYIEAFRELGAPIRAPTAAPNLEPRDDIWPTEPGPVIRRRADGVELAQLRWGFPPARPKGAPIINFRSEGRRFPVGRCLVPATHFFEFTGKKSPKSKWKFTRAEAEWFCFAGLWRPMPDGSGDAFTILTTDPGPDVAPIHNRQVVILDRAHWLPWLDLTRPESILLRPLPQGSLAVEQVR